MVSSSLPIQVLLTLWCFAANCQCVIFIWFSLFLLQTFIEVISRALQHLFMVIIQFALHDLFPTVISIVCATVCGLHFLFLFQIFVFKIFVNWVLITVYIVYILYYNYLHSHLQLNSTLLSMITMLSVVTNQHILLNCITIKPCILTLAIVDAMKVFKRLLLMLFVGIQPKID